MATVIDELVVTLGLDPKKFTQGQKDALAAFKQTQAQALKGAKDVEASIARTDAAISNVTQRFLGLLTLLVGGLGLKEFVVQTTKVNFETGRTAQLLDTTTKSLSAWRTVATLTGGTAAGITGAIGGLVTQFQNFSLTGESAVIPYFRALQVDLTDTSGRMRSMDDIMLDLADRFSKLDPARARAFGQALGFDEATISLLVRGRDAVAKILNEAKALGTVSKEDADAAAELTKQWNAAETAATRLGSAILTKLSPAIAGYLERFAKGLTMLREGKPASESSTYFAIARFLGIWKPGGSGTEPSEVWTGGRAGLNVKPGAGGASLATSALAHSLQQEIPGLDRFTAFKDTYHALLGRSAHNRGEALDFTLKNAAESAAVAAQVRKKLADMGIDATVLDEYTHPSRGSTGGHIHVQFNSADAARRYSELASGAPGAAVTSSVTNSSRSSRSETHVGTVVVNTRATDAGAIARDIKPAIERTSFASQANTGPE